MPGSIPRPHYATTSLILPTRLPGPGTCLPGTRVQSRPEASPPMAEPVAEPVAEPGRMRVSRLVPAVWLCLLLAGGTAPAQVPDQAHDLGRRRQRHPDPGRSPVRLGGRQRPAQPGSPHPKRRHPGGRCGAGRRPTRRGDRHHASGRRDDRPGTLRPARPLRRGPVWRGPGRRVRRQPRPVRENLLDQAGDPEGVLRRGQRRPDHARHGPSQLGGVLLRLRIAPGAARDGPGRHSPRQRRSRSARSTARGRSA